MKIIKKPTNIDKIWQQRDVEFSDMLKIVIDIKKRILAIDAEMHSDLEELLLQEGSDQIDLWGANIYPEIDGDGFLEFTSFINIRPSAGNKSMEVQDKQIREKIKDIVLGLLINV